MARNDALPQGSPNGTGDLGVIARDLHVRLIVVCEEQQMSGPGLWSCTLYFNPSPSPSPYRFGSDPAGQRNLRSTGNPSAYPWRTWWCCPQSQSHMSGRLSWSWVGPAASLGTGIVWATSCPLPPQGEYHTCLLLHLYFSCSSNSNSPPSSSSLCFGSSLLTSSPQSLLRHPAYVTLFMVDCKISVFPSECAPPQERPTLISLCVPSAQQRPGTELGAQ